MTIESYEDLLAIDNNLVIIIFVVCFFLTVIYFIYVKYEKPKKELIKHSNPIYCSGCGKEIVDKTGNFCSNCGYKLK